jgi:hypothetical protein
VPARLPLARAEDPHALELAQAQCLIRDVNESIHELASHGDYVGLRMLICECGDANCLTRIAVSASDYEAVRRFPTRFLVAPGHDLPGLDRPVDDKNTYVVVVEKVGIGAAAAIDSDPRRTN